MGDWLDEASSSSSSSSKRRRRDCDCDCAESSRRRRRRKQHLYLALDDWNDGYSIHKLDADDILDDDSGGVRKLPEPAAIRIRSPVRGPMDFAALGTDIFSPPARVPTSVSTLPQPSSTTWRPPPSPWDRPSRLSSIAWGPPWLPVESSTP